MERSMLPVLTEKTATYSGCCLALSIPLLTHLHAFLVPVPRLVLSIGSGYGLLEALLAREPYLLPVIGVEVEPSPNRYLPASSHRVVHGTRFLDPLAAEAVTWLFIYPRRVGLVREYMNEYDHGNLETIVWAGPKSDWPDYVKVFQTWEVQKYSGNTVGGRACELIVVASRNLRGKPA